MNETINFKTDFSSFNGSIHTLHQSSLKSYHIKIKRDSLDSEIIQKQNIMIHKLKTDNTVLKTYLTKAVSEINILKLQIQKTATLPKQSSELHDQIHNLETQNIDLKKQLEQIQSQFANYKDFSEKKTDDLIAEIAGLKRQMEGSNLQYKTLQYENSKKQDEINEKEKHIWELQSSIAELIESNYKKQSIIDKLRISQDQKTIRQDFRYLGSNSEKRREKSEDILIEGQQQITSSECEQVKKVDSSVQTEIYEVFQFSSRCVERNTPSKRKNHHMSPQTDKEQRIRQYARQLTQKQKQCINHEKTIQSLKKQNKQLQQKILLKQKQLKKFNKKCRQLNQKLNKSNSKIDFSSSSSSNDPNASINIKYEKSSIQEKQIIKEQIAIQTNETRIQNDQQNSQKKQFAQKANNKQQISQASLQQQSKKQKRRKNRTIEQDQQDGRQKLKSLIQDLQKKDSLLQKFQLEATRNRQTLNETRQKLRKKQNECKKLAKDLKGLKSELSENNPSHDEGEYSVIGSDSIKVQHREAEIQTAPLNIESAPLNIESIGFQVNNQKLVKQAQNILKEEFQTNIHNFNQGSNKKSEKDKQDGMDNQIQRISPSKQDDNLLQKFNSEENKFKNLDAKQLQIVISNRNTKIISHISPRSESHSHRESGQRIVNLQKIERDNEYLKRQNTALKYELEQLRKNWIEGLKTLQRQYCSESGSDFHSERDIIGAFSDYELKPKNIKNAYEQNLEMDQDNLNHENMQTNQVAIQTEEFEDQIDEEIIQFNRKRSSRMMEDKSQKSQTKSDQHHSHSKNQLSVSSETDEHYINQTRGNEKQTKKKRINNKLNLSKERVILKKKQNIELMKQIQKLRKALVQAKITQEELLMKLKQEKQSCSHNQKKLTKVQSLGQSQIQYHQIDHEQYPQNQAKQIRQSHSYPILSQIRQFTYNNQLNLIMHKEQKKLLEAEVQTEDHDAVEISCIQRAPDKNCDLSQRNDNLFDLEQPVTLQQEVQTEDIQLSFYRSFKIQSKEAHNVFESQKICLEDMPETTQFLVENGNSNKLNEKQNPIQQRQETKHEYGKLKQNNLEIQQEHENRDQNAGKANLHNQQESNILLQKIGINLNEFNFQGQNGKTVNSHKMKDERVESKCPSYMDDSQISDYKPPVQYQNVQIQTQEVEYSFSQTNDRALIKFSDDLLCLKCKLLQKKLQQDGQSELKASILNQQNIQLNVLNIDQNLPIESGFFQQLGITQPQHFVQSKIQILQSKGVGLNLSEKLNNELFSDNRSLQEERPLTIIQSRTEHFNLVNIIEVNAREKQTQIVIPSSDDPLDFEIKTTDSKILINQSDTQLQEKQLVDKIPTNLQKDILKDLKSNDEQNLVNNNFGTKLIHEVVSQNKQNLNNQSQFQAFKQERQKQRNNQILQKDVQIYQKLNQFKNQATIYKEQLILTQAQNFRLERQLHQFTIKISTLNAQIQALNQKISFSQFNASQKNDAISSLRNQNQCLKVQNSQLKDQIQKYEKQGEQNKKQLKSTKQMFDKLKAQHSRIIASLDRYVDDSSDGNTPGKKRLLRDFQGTSPLHQLNEISVNTRKIPSIENQILNFQVQEKSDEKQLLNEQKQLINSFQSQISALSLALQMTNEKQQKTETDKKSKKENQKNLLKVSGIEAREIGSIEEKKDQISELQGRIVEIKKQVKDTEDKDRFSKLMISNAESQTVKCKQCQSYSMSIKQLEQIVLKLTVQINELSTKDGQRQNFNPNSLGFDYNINKQIKPKIIICPNQIDASKEAQFLINQIHQLGIGSDQIQNCHLIHKIYQKTQGQIPQIQLTNKLLNSQAQILNVREEFVKSEKIVEEEVEQQLEQENFDQIFKIQNIENLPLIYFEYNDNFIYRTLNNPIYNIVDSERISSIKDHKKHQQNFNNLIVLETQQQIQQLYKPALIVNHGEIDRKLNNVKGFCKKSGNEFSDQGSQTVVMTKFEEQKHTFEELGKEIKLQNRKITNQKRKNQQIGEIQQQVNQKVDKSLLHFPLIHLSTEQSSGFYRKTQRQLQNPFNPILLTSIQSNKILSSSKYYLKNETNQMLLQNFFSHHHRLSISSQKALTHQLTILGQKVQLWISKLSKCTIKQSSLGSVRREELEEDLLLEEQCQISGKEQEKGQNLQQRKNDSKEVVKEIMDLIGADFLVLRSMKGENSLEKQFEICDRQKKGE